MKYYILFMLHFGCLGASANPDSFYLFFDGGVGQAFALRNRPEELGTAVAGKLSLSAVYKRHSVSLACFFSIKDASNTPPDYDEGFTLFGGGKPTVFQVLGGVMYGRVWYLPYHTRFILKGGLFTGTYTYAENYVYQKPTGMFFQSSNYTYEDKSSHVYFFRLNPVLELPTRVIGISVGAFAMLGNMNSSAGVEANILLGKIRSKARPEKSICGINIKLRQP